MIMKLCFFAVVSCIVLVSVVLYMNILCIKYLKEITRNVKDKDRKFKRQHSAIKQANFSNPIITRKNPYEKYQNEKGLYEPRIPKKNLKIKED